MYSNVPARALFLHDSYLRCVQVWEHLKGRETRPKEILKLCSFDVKGLPLCCIKVWFKLCLLVLQALFTFQLGRMSGSFFKFAVCEQITFSPSAPWEQKLLLCLKVYTHILDGPDFPMFRLTVLMVLKPVHSYWFSAWTRGRPPSLGPNPMSITL